MKRILFVDDDPEINLSTRRLFYSLNRDWQVTFAHSGEDALEKLREKPYDVLVSDIRMPGMSGIDLLEQARLNYPHVARIALSGHVDREASLKASGLVHQFLAKPSSAENIMAAIQQALSTGSMIEDEEIRRVLGQLKSIPSQPQAYLQIVDELNKKEPSIGNVGRIISQDASMSAKVLQLINSAFFGLPQKVIDPVQAATLLGIETIRDLALGIGVFNQFDAQKLQTLSLTSLWNHSQRTSGLAKMIAQRLQGDKRQANYSLVSGLLHDVGKLILADNFPKKYQKVVHLWKTRNQPIEVIEQDVFGTTHAQVGAYLFSLWGLPETIIHSVAWHHEPAQAKGGNSLVLLTVHAANVIDYQCQPNLNPTGLAPQFDVDFLRDSGAVDQVDNWRIMMLENVDGGW